MTKEDFVASLNNDLELEYRSIVQYFQHIASVKGARYQQTLDELAVHVKQELEHALTLARQIDFLGGTPSVQVPDIAVKTDAAEALGQDLELEENQLKRYRERTQQAEELGLPDVAEVLAPLLQQTQEHVRDLRAVLDR
jgi:bacterioferritin